jgi:signal transduction histidine kinase
MILAAYIVLVLFEFHVERYHPAMVSTYKSELIRWIDGLTTTLYTIVFLYLIIQFILKNYTYERLKAERSEKNIQLLNRTLEKKVKERTEEILLKNHILRVAGKTALFGSWYLEPALKKLYWSGEVKAIHEVPDDYVPSIEKDSTFYKPEYRERIHSTVSACILNGTPFDEQVQIITNGGKTIWIRITGEAEKNSEGNVIRVIGSFQNIDSSKKTEEDLRIAKLEAEIANNAKSRFLLNVGHEFRTPLNAVIGYADLIKTAEGKAKSDYSEAIKSSGRRLLDMVSNILEMIRAEKAEIVLNNDFLDTYRFFRDFESLFASNISEKGLKFKTDLADDLPAFILIDEQRLGLVVNNLVDNAIKFTDKGEIELKVYQKKDQSVTTNITDLVIEIKDTGKGISEEQRKMIFEAFSQTEEKSIANGIGIGLSLSSRIISRMNGTINLTSQPGMGCRFVVTLSGVTFKEDGVTDHLPAETGPDTQSADKISRNEITDLTGLINALEVDHMITFKTLQTRQPLNDVRKFGESLALLGKKHNCTMIVEYGQKLSDAAGNFDIEGMLRLIRRYPENIKILKS